MPTVFTQAPHLLVTGGALLVLLSLFVSLFLIPGYKYWFVLSKTIRNLKSLPKNSGPDDLKAVFSVDQRLAHLWSEYSDTLHSQRREQSGQMVVVAIRSTITADTYFNSQVVVDSRLRADFFRHIPGIFTGIGIIGTFFGLIEGLKKFEISDNASVVRDSLTFLMEGVEAAFVISASAIVLAIAVTLLEKWLLAALYKQTEDIALDIDARFESGAGEDYLARLVSSSEDSASQSKMLKDALVKELGDILRDIAESQLRSSQQGHAALAKAIATSIKEGLSEPLGDIAKTVRQASGEQSATAVQMLNDVMVSFSQRLNDLFGGQINGINELNRQSAQSMQEAVASLNTLIGKLEENGKQATNEMSEAMLATITAMEQRQTAMNAQTQEAVNQIRILVENSQTATQEKVREILEAIAGQMATLLAQLGTEHKKGVDESREREKETANRTSSLMGEMTDSVSKAVAEIAAASQTMALSVETLSSTTSASVEKMNFGADKLGVAASNFAAAGDKVTAIMGQVATVGGKLSELSGQLSSSAASLQEVLRDYKTQRQAVSELLTEVRSTIEIARKDASVTSDILSRIESSAAKLAEAHKSADEYLEGINEVLATSNAAFRDAVVSTLTSVNRDFHAQLSTAVGLLGGAVQELEVSLGSFAPQN